MVVPPPMAAHSVDFPSPIQAVTFAPPPVCNDIAVQLSDSRIVFLKTDVKEVFKAPGEAPKIISTCR